MKANLDFFGGNFCNLLPTLSTYEDVFPRNGYVLPGNCGMFWLGTSRLVSDKKQREKRPESLAGRTTERAGMSGRRAPVSQGTPKMSEQKLSTYLSAGIQSIVRASIS